ncbi:hypothetical protein L3Q67_32980 [Saccharothrix sp. AJ9571]|nr:hypothetical protein L3Q67_32980 [Saccharothrix sp. AJ9571]
MADVVSNYPLILGPMARMPAVPECCRLTSMPAQAPLPQTKPAKFAALVWASLILGIVGVVGSPIIFLNNLTAVAAAVGLVLQRHSGGVW